MILGFCGWDRVGQGGFAGWCVGFWGLVGCFRVRGFVCVGWGVALGSGGSVLTSRGVVLGLGLMVLGNVVLGFGAGQVGSRVGWGDFVARCCLL